MRAQLFVLVLATGCYHPSPAAGTPCSSLGTCPSGLECVDDLCQDPGTLPIDAAIDACPAASCLGGDLAGCGIRITCANGCADTSTTAPAHCAQLVPSNGISVALLAGATADFTGIDYDFNTTTGEIAVNGNVIRPAGTGVIDGIGFTVIDMMGVFTAHSFTISPLGGNTGNDWDSAGANALVLFSATTIDVQGAIDVGAVGQSGGPGGASGGTTGSSGPTCRGKAGLWQAANFGEGGGGGGGRHAGAAGAPSNLATFGAGGPSCSFPLTQPLRGGSGGGAGGVDTAPTPTVHGGFGGGGGGALGLVAMESITISGTVTAPGDGGLTSATGDGGGGGGSGGAILLESPVVTLAGNLTAHGGGGGGPSVNNGVRGHQTDGGQASGGVYMTASGGKGGTGAAIPTAGTTYHNGLGTMARGGGGGGSEGRTEIKARSKVTTGATLSPAPTLGDVTLQ